MSMNLYISQGYFSDNINIQTLVAYYIIIVALSISKK